MNEPLQKLEARWDALALRERTLVLGALIAGLVGFFDASFLRPLDEENARLEAERTQIQQESIRLAEHSRELASQVATGEAGPLVQERARIIEQTRRLDTRIEEHLSSMLPPGEVARMFEALLERDGELELQRVSSLKPRTASSPETNRETGAEPPRAARKPDFYHHGFRLELEGTYLATLAYLEAIESLSWDLSWDRMVYEVTEYPRARITIELHTLSDDEGWIGV